VTIEPLYTSRTAHIYLAGCELDKAEFVWLILHGYAQSPETMIPAFEGLRGKHAFVMPEAFSKFYRRGFEGQVVSSWMTAKHRLDEIHDQKIYLDKVYQHYLKEAPGQKICLAFSQGVATGNRWLDDTSGIEFDKYILYAGWPPEDCRYEQSIWKKMKLVYALGDQDYFLDVQRVKRLKKQDFFKKAKVDWIHYSGGHTLETKIIEQCLKI